MDLISILVRFILACFLVALFYSVLAIIANYRTLVPPESEPDEFFDMITEFHNDFR